MVSNKLCSFLLPSQRDYQLMAPFISDFSAFISKKKIQWALLSDDVKSSLYDGVLNSFG